MIFYGGEHVPGGSIVALEKIISAYTLYRFKEVLEADALIRLTHRLQFNTKTDKRIWFKTFSNDQFRGYVNLVPGEFSNDEPKGDIVVIEARASAKDSTLKNELKELIESYVCKDNREKELMNCLNKHIEQEDVPCDMSLFKVAAEEIRTSGSREFVQNRVNSLFTQGYDNYAMPLDHFSKGILMIQLNLQFSQFVLSEAFDNLSDSIHSYVSTLRSKNILDLSKYADLAHFFYEEAEKAHNEALVTPNQGYQTSRLRYAAFNYSCAHQMAKISNDQKIGAPIDYKDDIAEEGYACCISGLNYHNIILNPFEAIAEELSGQVLSDQSGEFKVLSNLSSHSKPMTTRFLARVLIGRVKTKASGKMYEEGLAQLHKLESEVDLTISQFERHFLLLALMKSYEGNEEMQKRYATKVAINMVF